MSEPTSNPTPTVIKFDEAAVFKFDEAAFVKLLDTKEKEISSNVDKIKGVSGHNPFLALDKISKLRAEFKSGGRSKELFDAAVAISTIAVPANVVAGGSQIAPGAPVPVNGISVSK